MYRSVSLACFLFCGALWADDKTVHPSTGSQEEEASTLVSFREEVIVRAHVLYSCSRIIPSLSQPRRPHH